MASLTDKVKGAAKGLAAATLIGTGSLFYSGCDSGFVEPNRPPVSEVYAEPMQGYTPLEVNFDASESSDPDGNIVNYRWDVDNDNVVDTTTTSPYLTHTYTDEGMHATSVIVEDDDGDTDKASVRGIEAIRPNEAPNMVLTANPMNVYIGQEINFDGSESTDDTGIEEYRWDFNGDGVFEDTTATPTTNYLYSSAGTFTAVLQGMDDDGATASTSLEGIVVQVPEQIAFWSLKDGGKGEIYTGGVTEDSLINIQRLTTNQFNDVWPSWSQDGERLVFASNREDATGDGLLDTVLWTMNAEGSNPIRLTPEGVGYASSPTWCADGKIYFNYWGKHWNPSTNTQGIARINPDGTDLEKITEETFNNRLSERPVCSPNASKIAYVSFIDGNSEIYVSNLDGSNAERLTNNPSEDILPTWTPERNIVFSSNRNGDTNLYEINSETKKISEITNRTGIETDADVSSKGKIIFAYDESGFDNPGINIVNLNGSEFREIFSEISRYPVWRPNSGNN